MFGRNVKGRKSGVLVKQAVSGVAERSKRFIAGKPSTRPMVRTKEVWLYGTLIVLPRRV